MPFAHSEKDKICLLVNIQSAVISVSIVHRASGALPTIIFSTDEAIVYRKDYDEAKLVSATIEATERSIAVALKELHHSVGIEIHFILSSPWIISHAKTLEQKFARATIISRKTISDIIGKERANFLPTNSANLIVIEEKIFDITLNGYVVDEWQGRSAISLGVSLVISIAGEGMIDRLRHVCKNQIHKVRSIHFHSALLLEYIGIQALMPRNENYVLLDIHGEYTDVAIIENERCAFFGTFNIGIDTVVRAVAKPQDLTTQIADSLLSLYIGGHMASAEERKSEKILDEIGHDWTQKICELIKKSTYEDKLPNQMIIITNRHEDFFAMNYKKVYSASNEIAIENDSMRKVVSFGNRVSVRDQIGLETLALNTIESLSNN